MLLYPALKIIDGVSLGSSFASPPISVREYNTSTFQMIFTGAPSGKLELQASCETEPVSWVDLPEFPVSISTATVLMYNYSQYGWYWMRFVYTFTAGSGVGTVLMTGK